MLQQLIGAGYDVCGISPDPGQIHLAQEKSDAQLVCSSLEDFDGKPQYFDVVIFQESSQYIDPLVIFGKALRLLAENGHLIILDEVALKRTEFGHEGLHLLQTLLLLSRQFGFEVVQNVDLSAKAAPTLDYLLRIVEQHRERIISDLGCSAEQINALNISNSKYRDKYLEGRFGYAFLHFRKLRIPRWRLEYGGEARSEAIRGLFQEVFGHPMSKELWRWKYSDHRGCSLVTWKDDELVAHYGGMARLVDFFAEPRTVVQIGDVMVHPSEQGVLTKKGSFYLTASAFFELKVGYGREYAASFGFPNERAMRLAQTLGLYGEVDRMVEMTWPATKRKNWWM
ncbi:MAG: GNAT family N-acetyltransferase, partial [Rhodocyclaceae bacterium]